MSRKQASVDPLESAKIINPPPPPPPTPKQPVVVAAPPPPPPAPPKVTHTQKYRVKVGKQVSLFGQIVYLPPDTVVGADSYGHEGVQRIIDAGVELEKVQ